MTIDFDLFDAAIEDAATEANGYKHQQANWASVVNLYADDESSCGTAMCLAGFAAVRCGAEVPRPALDPNGFWYVPNWWVNAATGALSDEDDPEAVHVSNFARIRLGLDWGQADELFSAANTLDQIRGLRNHLAKHPDAGRHQLEDVRWSLRYAAPAAS